MKEQANEVKTLYGTVGEIPQLSAADIWPLKLLGRGAFGKVYLVRINDNYFAMKQVKKKLILRKQQLENLLYEVYILQAYEHPFLVKMQFVYQDTLNVYLVMEFVQGGELFYHLKMRKKFDQKTTAFFAAQIVLVLEFLHNVVGIVYRDLKPENILIQKDGYLKLADLGLAKTNSKLCYSFCGTAEYLAPEMIEEKGHNSQVDIWALGCIIYEMLFGQPPFQDPNRKTLFIKIQTSQYTFPDNCPSDAKSLISGLLQYDAESRLTFHEIKQHAFFKSIDFDKILRKELVPPFQPLLMTQTDTRNFEYITESQMAQSLIQLKSEEQALFDDFPCLKKQIF